MVLVPLTHLPILPVSYLFPSQQHRIDEIEFSPSQYRLPGLPGKWEVAMTPSQWKQGNCSYQVSNIH